MTQSQRHELYVYLVGLSDTIKYARYDNFRISDKEHGYVLSLGEFEGNVDDALRDSENMAFTTSDRDNDDLMFNNCADYYKSGWWYKRSSDCNLNALYGPQQYWRESFPLKEAKVLIRPKSLSRL